MYLVRCSHNDEKTDNRSSSSSINNGLTDDLLIDILSRLPCRSATQFKSVCKHWYSLISSDYFITFFNHRRHGHYHDDLADPDSSYHLVCQFHKSNRLPASGYFDYSSLVQCRSVSRFESSVVAISELDLSFIRSEGVSVVASCGDLILCSNPDPEDPSRITNFYLCNLLTKQWSRLPRLVLRLARRYHYYATGLLCVPAPCSLCLPHGHEGVDNSHYKFVVLRVYLSLFGRDLSRLIIKVFSSEQGEWTSHVVKSPEVLPNENIGNMVPYKGMLHWLSFPYVVVFDPYNTTTTATQSIISRVIEMRGYRMCTPDSGYTCPPEVHNICVWQDRLRVVCSIIWSKPKCHYIWELEDYDKGKWELKCTIAIADESSSEAHMRPAYVHPDGTTLTRRENNPSFWVRNYDMQSGTADDEDNENVKYDLIVPDGTGLYLQRSVSVHRINDPHQWWPTPVDQNHLYNG